EPSKPDLRSPSVETTMRKGRISQVVLRQLSGPPVTLTNKLARMFAFVCERSPQRVTWTKVQEGLLLLDAACGASRPNRQKNAASKEARQASFERYGRKIRTELGAFAALWRSDGEKARWLGPRPTTAHPAAPDGPPA